MPAPRRVAFRVIAVLALVGGAGCAVVASEHDLSIRVTGTGGTRLVGQCVLMTEGIRVERALDETVPFDLDLVGTELSCYLQKQGQDGTVWLSLTRNGDALAFASTRTRFGSVSVTTP